MASASKAADSARACRKGEGWVTIKAPAWNAALPDPDGSGFALPRANGSAGGVYSGPAQKNIVRGRE
ncbi:MAG: hypothetical protein CFE32_24680 [Alphaproteobacteria bacterium PA3]|nr:MAG: hypothetical protein CFE32_24680 [Alphaproteobacteria bacterium PA3]